MPIIASLFDLPLSGHPSLAAKAVTLAREALSVVDEADVGTVVRTLVKTMDEAGAHHHSGGRSSLSSSAASASASASAATMHNTSKLAVADIRSEALGLSSETLRSVVDVLAETLPMSATAPGLFLAALTQATLAHSRSGPSGGGGGGGGGGVGVGGEKGGKGVAALSPLDVAVVLLLVPAPQHAEALEGALVHLVTTDTFPFALLREAAVAGGQWSSLVPVSW